MGGLRARTRDKFSKAYRTKGAAGLSTYLAPYKVGDFVDIKADASVQKGMPYNFYHGRTGRVFNITAHAVGVEMTKVVRGKQLRKRIHVRIEHCKRSRCQADFIVRRSEKIKLLADAKAAGKAKPVLKRTPIGPRPMQVIRSKTAELEVFTPLMFEANTF